MLSFFSFSKYYIQLGSKERKERRKKNYASSKKAPHIKEKGPLGKKPLHQKRKGWPVGIRRVASDQASRPLLISC